MKQRFFRIGVLAVALSFSLALYACGVPQEAIYTTADAETLLASGAFDESMAPVDGDIVAVLYGIDASTVEECVSYLATNTSVSADELTILVLTDGQAAQAALEACQARVESQIAVCESYAPAAVPRLESAVIRQAGNTVLLAVGDPEVLPGAVDALHA